MNFALHYSILKCFKNNNIVSQVFRIFFSVNASFSGKISREIFNIPFKHQTLQREIQMFILFSEILTMRDVNWL